MTPRTISALTLAAIVAGATAASPVLAAPKPKPKPKPITKTYEAMAFPPDPTPILDANVQPPTKTNFGNCQPTIPQAAHLEPFKAPAAGTIDILLNNFQGDWALGLRNKTGKNLADSDNDITTAASSTSEHIKYKIKAKMDLTIAACNFAGGPTATVKYTFTYA